MNDVQLIYLIQQLFNFILNNTKFNYCIIRNEALNKKLNLEFDYQIVLREQEQNGRSVIRNDLLIPNIKLPIIFVFNVSITIR